MILCIGQSAFDLTIPVDKYPEENKKIKVSDVYECGGGASNNAAYLLALWHNDVYFATSIGKDESGMKIKNELSSVGVKLNYLNELDNVKTTTSYILANRSNGTRTIITHASPLMHFDSNYNIDIKPSVILFDGKEIDLALRTIKNNPEAIKIIDAGGYNETAVELSKYFDNIVCSNDFARGYTGIDFDYNDINKIHEVYDLIQKDYVRISW